ncbi:hypothetical protein ROLI_040170 [Roseobacter fucihabitans]|uniref:Uncharacterized protein n=1 Tax=Roseobacter fucihabitans TaxID=1537242 RepID=A0ABZ2BXW2_9RHOB|nr:hypothetical protein [Roseobacter litoralis]
MFISGSFRVLYAASVSLALITVSAVDETNITLHHTLAEFFDLKSGLFLGWHVY